MNDVLHPVPNEWSAAFIAALSNWLIQLGKISKPSNYSFVDFLNMKGDNQPLEELAVLILKLGNITPSCKTIQMLKELEERIKQSSIQQEKAIAVIAFKDSLPQSLVLGPYDGQFLEQ